LNAGVVEVVLYFPEVEGEVLQDWRLGGFINIIDEDCEFHVGLLDERFEAFDCDV
jgi:hypothetical protein